MNKIIAVNTQNFPVQPLFHFLCMGTCSSRQRCTERIRTEFTGLIQSPAFSHHIIFYLGLIIHYADNSKRISIRSKNHIWILTNILKFWLTDPPCMRMSLVATWTCKACFTIVREKSPLISQSIKSANLVKIAKNTQWANVFTRIFSAKQTHPQHPTY